MSTQGTGMGGAGLDPEMMQKLSQLAHGGLDGLLQWAVKSLLPVLMRGMSGDMGAMNEIMNAQKSSLKNTAFQSGDLSSRLAAAAAVTGATSAPGPHSGGRRFYFLSAQSSDSTELRKIASVAAKISKELGIKK